MAPRANERRYLKLSLVSCAVALFPATSIRETGPLAAPKSTALKRVPAKRTKIKRAS